MSCSRPSRPVVKAGFDACSAYHNFGWWAAFGGELMDAAASASRHDRRRRRLRVPRELQDAGATLYDVRRHGQRLQGRRGRPDRRRQLGARRLPRRPGANLGVAPMPAGPGGPGSRCSASTAGTSTPRQEPELAVALALALTNPEAQQVFADVAGHVPANTSHHLGRDTLQGFARRLRERRPAAAGPGARQLLGQLRQRAEPRPPDGRGPAGGRHRGLRGDEHRQQHTLAQPVADSVEGGHSAGASASCPHSHPISDHAASNHRGDIRG